MKSFKSFTIAEKRLLPRYFDKPGKGKDKIKIKWISPTGSNNDLKRLGDFYSVKLQKAGKDQVFATGDKHDLIWMLQSDDYGMEYDDIKKQFPGLFK